ncbi:TolC family protein [Parabacteroides sp. Marseille-P3160]|uniref:TolC family protein n=1 Tax=Parabacteroides sp. Marseille-P3160 TaxID=1917887 RepID=UPI0009BA3F46|nr:TolC family protein [Parabacteroides sp. Marseille-P3160]
MKRIVLLFAFLILIGNVYSQQLLTLEECRALAIQNNKNLRIGNEKIKIADADRKAALTKYFPQISATGAYLWNEKDINLFDFNRLGAAGALVPQSLKDVLRLDIENIWLGNLSLVQPVFMGGKIISYNQLASYAKQLAESMNDQELQNVIYKTDETYWQVISLVNKKKLADSYVELLEKMDSDVSALIAEGVATAADGLSVKVKLNEAEMTQTQVENGLSLTRMLLAQLCGLPIEKPLALADENLERLPLSVTAATEATADVTEAFMNRPELKSLDLATKIFKKKEAITLADALPNLALIGGYTIMNPNSYYGFKNEFAGSFNIGLMLKIPLSGWWENTYKRNAARAETHIKQLEWENAREQIELQVNQSIYKVNEANKKQIATVRNMEKAEENLRTATLGFEEGVIPVLQLMEAQTAWLSARSNLIDSQIEVKLADVYLTKAMGKLSTDVNSKKE